MRVFAQCNQWQCSSQQTVTKKSRGLISAVIIKGNKSEEKAIYFDEKITTYQGNSLLVLSLLKSQIMHTEEFVLIPKRMFISKNQIKEEIFDNPIYQQKATQLSLLQRSNPNFEQSSGKKDADTSTDRRIIRTRSTGDGTSNPDDVKSELFVSDDSEIEPVVKKRKDSAFDSIMLELKLMDENKTKRAAIILKKIFDSNTVSISEENNVLHIEDEPQGVKVTNFLNNLQPTKKIDVQKYSKILSELDIAAHLVYNTHAKKVLDEFYSEEEEEQPTRKQKKQQQKQPRGRSETKEKSAKPKVDESKKKTDEDTSRKDWAFYR